jgi:choline-sulfatase
MKRKICLLSVLLFCIASAGSRVHSQAPAPQAPSIRNVLFIMGDDHSAGVLGCYGNKIVRTPNLDRLASQGTRFDRAYVNCPMCTPSRQSLITGKLPHAVGVTVLQTPLAENQVTIAEHLKGLGFATGAVGKMHFNSDLKHGFDYRFDKPDHQNYLKDHPGKPLPAGTKVKPVWKPFKDPARIWLNADGLPVGIMDADSEGTYFSKKAIEFLRNNKDNRFCLWVSYNQPHSPFDFPVEYAGKYDPAKMPLPQTSPEDAPWIPAIFKDLTDADKRGIVASYYSAVEYHDKNVGMVLDELKRLGLEESTLVVYVGDHGYLLGHHGRFEKHSMWEPAVRAPLIVRRGTGKGQVASNEALVEFVDLVPTILEELKVSGMTGLQGMSFTPVINGKTRKHRESVFSEYLVDNRVMLRSAEWKYVFTTGKTDLGLGYATGNPPPGITHSLYDLKNDPGETRNLAKEPKHRAKLQELQQALLRRFKETHPLAKEFPVGASVEEALVWFSDPPDAKVSLAGYKF